MPVGAQVEQMGGHPQQELGQAMNLDRSPGGADLDPNQYQAPEEEEEISGEQSMGGSMAQ